MAPKINEFSAQISLLGGSKSVNAFSAEEKSPSPRDGFLHRLLAAHPAKFGKILENASEYRFQVILSVLGEGEQGQTVLRRHEFRADAEYFYPASSIKLCAAIAALQKVRRTRRKLPGALTDCTTPLAFLPLLDGQQREETDASNLDGSVITIGHEIRKLFLVSDNCAFNRLYDFVGQRRLNQAMWDLGLSSARLRHRLSDPSSEAEYRMGRPVEAMTSAEGGAFCLPPKRCQLAIPSSRHLAGIRVGRAYIEEDGKRVEAPMDFSLKNVMSLRHLHRLLTLLFHPNANAKTEGSGSESPSRIPDLDGVSEIFLKEAMVEYPDQSRNPRYRKQDYPDDYCKFFLPGLCRVRPKAALRIFNKIGQAFGFTVENAYIVDIERGRDLYLSTIIYTNFNGVLNDDQYEYDTAYRVKADVAEVVARAVWQIPPNQSLTATSFDCIPSELWGTTVEVRDGAKEGTMEGAMEGAIEGVMEGAMEEACGAEREQVEGVYNVQGVEGGDASHGNGAGRKLPSQCETLLGVEDCSGPLEPLGTIGGVDVGVGVGVHMVEGDVVGRHLVGEDSRNVIITESQVFNKHGKDVVDINEIGEDKTTTLEEGKPPRRRVIPCYRYFVDE